MRSTLILIGTFSLSTFTAAAYAATGCDRLAAVHLDHAVVTDARLVPEGPGEPSTYAGRPGASDAGCPLSCAIRFEAHV